MLFFKIVPSTPFNISSFYNYVLVTRITSSRVQYWTFHLPHHDTCVIVYKKRTMQASHHALWIWKIIITELGQYRWSSKVMLANRTRLKYLVLLRSWILLSKRITSKAKAGLLSWMIIKQHYDCDYAESA